MNSLEKANQSLLGLWVGDAFGGHFEFEHVDWHRPRRAFENRELPPAIWRFTDDTQMALSIYDILRQFGEIKSDELAKSFAVHFDISRGYGLGAEQLLLDVKAGADWSLLAPAMFDGTGSSGNGSSMRVAPVGAYFANDFDAVAKNARASSIITHQHPDGIAGAIAVALAAAQATRFANDNKRPSSEVYWQAILDHTPESTLKDKLRQAADINLDTPTEKVARTIGCGWNISAIDTVPFALWCAITFMDDYEEALWQTISVGGDADTTCAIVGGIIASYGGKDVIPMQWKERCEPLPTWAFS